MIWRRGREQRKRDFLWPDSSIVDRHPTRPFGEAGQRVVIIGPITASNSGPSLDPTGLKAQHGLDFGAKDTSLRHRVAQSDDAR